MRELKHLPVNEWPEADRAAFRAAYEPGDVFDGTAGPGAHLAEGTRGAIRFTYRRCLPFSRRTILTTSQWLRPIVSRRSGCALSSII